jgi:hypothetical protein
MQRLSSHTSSLKKPRQSIKDHSEIASRSHGKGHFELRAHPRGSEKVYPPSLPPSLEEAEKIAPFYFMKDKDYDDDNVMYKAFPVHEQV